MPRSARMSCGRGGCPLYPGDCGARTAGRSSPAAARRLAAARPCTPVQQPTTGGFLSRGIIKGSLSFTRPAFPSPVAPGWSGSPRACPPGLHTPPLPAAHAGVGTGIVGTCLSYVTISWSSSQRSHSPRATSCRTDQLGAGRRDPPESRPRGDPQGRTDQLAHAGQCQHHGLHHCPSGRRSRDRRNWPTFHGLQAVRLTPCNERRCSRAKVSADLAQIAAGWCGRQWRADLHVLGDRSCGRRLGRSPGLPGGAGARSEMDHRGSRPPRAPATPRYWARPICCLCTAAS